MVVYNRRRITSTYIKTWLKDRKELAPRSVILVLKGNKIDLEEKRVISKEKEEF